MIVLESKQDEIDFREMVDDDKLVDRFLDYKAKSWIRGPETSFTYWKNKSNNELRNYLDNAEAVYKKNNVYKELKKQVDADVLLNNDNYIVYLINNFAASFVLGNATGWCTSGRYDGNWNPECDTHYVDYTDDGRHQFIFVCDKSEKVTMEYHRSTHAPETDFKKYAIRFDVEDKTIDEITDAVTDRSVNTLQFLRKHLGIMDAIKPYVSEDPDFVVAYKDAEVYKDRLNLPIWTGKVINPRPISVADCKKYPEILTSPNQPFFLGNNGFNIQWLCGVKNNSIIGNNDFTYAGLKVNKPAGIKFIFNVEPGSVKAGEAFKTPDKKFTLKALDDSTVYTESSNVVEPAMPEDKTKYNYNSSNFKAQINAALKYLQD